VTHERLHQQTRLRVPGMPSTIGEARSGPGRVAIHHEATRRKNQSGAAKR